MHTTPKKIYDYIGPIFCRNYTAKIRNKLSPVFNALKMFQLWDQEKDPNLKQQIFQILQQEVAKGNNNFQKIHRYLNQINLNFE